MTFVEQPGSGTARPARLRAPRGAYAPLGALRPARALVAVTPRSLKVTKTLGKHISHFASLIPPVGTTVGMGKVLFPNFCSICFIGKKNYHTPISRFLVMSFLF